MMRSACNRSSLVLLLVLGIVFGSDVHPSVRAEISYFPIPAVSTSENDGTDVGMILPILVSDPDGTLTSLIAPMVVHNSFLGARGTINYFKYWTAGRQLRFIGSYTDEIERKLDIHYTDPGLAQGLFTWEVGGSFFKNATKRFFGFGEGSDDDDESNYTSREFRANWNFGVYLNEVTRLALGQRFRKVKIRPGGVDSKPFTRESFPTAQGIDGATLLGNRLSFHYDTRDSVTTPTAGSLIAAYAELVQDFKNNTDPFFSKYGLDVQQMFPTESKRTIFVLRGNIQATFGNEIPFYEQSSLGGQNNLRGYGEDRFIDQHLVAVSVEQRLHMLGLKMFNVQTEFEVAPFVDIGRVFDSFRDFPSSDYEVTPGIGFRGIVRPNLIARVDYGYSNEGGAVFAGLDYPF